MDDYYDKFSDTIGELLGIQLAYAEHDLREDVEDDATEAAFLAVQRIAAIYRDFAKGEFPGFRDDFSKGYKYGKDEIRSEREPAHKHGSQSSISTETDPRPS